MFGDHLHEMIRSGMRLVMVAVVVIAIVIRVMKRGRSLSRGISFVVMSLRGEVVANVTGLEYEQQRQQHSHPPVRRSWLVGPRA